MSFGRTSPSGRLERLVVDARVRLADAVGMDLEEAAREVEGHAVGQVTAVGQVHAHDPVAGLEDRHVGGRVRLARPRAAAR